MENWKLKKESTKKINIMLGQKFMNPFSNLTDGQKDKIFKREPLS